MDKDSKWEVGGGERERERGWRRRERGIGVARDLILSFVSWKCPYLTCIIHNMEINRMIKSGSFVSMG
jgi:hypothetical protein